MIRSPSGSAPGMMRGLAPVAINTTSASMVFCSPLPSVARTWCAAMPRSGSVSSAVPERTSTPTVCNRARMSEDWDNARLLTREWIFGSDTEACSGSRVMPRSDARRMSVRIPVDAMNVFDGTQSNSTHAPPTPSESTRVTVAPCCAATSAAS